MKVKAGQDIEERAVILGRYILEHKATVRAAAKQFGISKSTVHKDITEKLPVICPQTSRNATFAVVWRQNTNTRNKNNK